MPSASNAKRSSLTASGLSSSSSAAATAVGITSRLSSHHHLSVVVNGRVLTGDDLRDYAERNGLCPICAQTRTHSRQGISRKWVPKALVQTSQGVTIVYKGYCIQPTCYTSVEQVQHMLGEVPKAQHRVRRSSTASASKAMISAAMTSNTINDMATNGTSTRTSRSWPTTNTSDADINISAQSITAPDSITSSPKPAATPVYSPPAQLQQQEYSLYMGDVNPHTSPRGSFVRNKLGAASVPAVELSSSQLLTHNGPNTSLTSSQKSQSTLPETSMYPSMDDPGMFSPENTSHKRFSMTSAKFHNNSKTTLQQPPLTAPSPPSLLPTRNARRSSNTSPACSDPPSNYPSSHHQSFNSVKTSSSAPGHLYSGGKHTTTTADNHEVDYETIKVMMSPTNIGVANQSANGNSNRGTASRRRSKSTDNLKKTPAQNTDQPYMGRALPSEFSHLQTSSQFLQQQEQYLSQQTSSRTNTSNTSYNSGSVNFKQMNESQTDIHGNSGMASTSSMSLSSCGSGSISKTTQNFIPRTIPEADRPVILELQEFISGGDYLGFLACLERKAKVSTVCPPAFVMFTKHLVKNQRASPNAILLAGDNWIKTLYKCVKEFYALDVEVAISGLTTFLSLSSLPKNYKNVMAKRGAAVECVLKLMDRYGHLEGTAVTSVSSSAGATSATNAPTYNSTVITLICAWMERMASNEENGISAKTKGDVATVIRKLVTYVVIGSDPTPKPFALRALAHWASHKKRSPPPVEKTLGHDIKTAFQSMQQSGTNSPVSSIMALQNIVQEQLFPTTNQDGSQVHSDSTVLEASLSLLWRLSVPNTEEEIGNMDVNWSSVAWLNCLHAIIKQQMCSPLPSLVILEACTGILANLSVLTQFPLECAAPFLETIVQCIQEHVIQIDHAFLAQFSESSTSLSPHERLALAGVHAICNLLSSRSRRDRALMRQSELRNSTIECILGVLKKHPTIAELQELVCLAISYLCKATTSHETRDRIVELGAIECIANSFNKCVAVASNGPTMDVKEATLCALATLSRSPSGADAITQSPMAERLALLVVVETLPKFQALMRDILANCASGGISPNGADSMRKPYPVLSGIMPAELVDHLHQFIENLSPNSIPFLGQAIERLFECLEGDKKKAKLQDEGCFILASLFFLLPFEEWNEPVKLEDVIVSEILVTDRSLQLLNAVMKQNRKNSSVQISACIAVTNLLAKLDEKSGPEAHPQMQRLIEPFLKQVLDILECHRHEDAKVDKAAINLFWLLVLSCSPTDLLRWSVRIYQSILRSMIEFQSNQEVILLACECILAMKDNTECMEAVGTSEGVAIFMKMQLSQYDTVAIASAGVLAAILKQVFTASRFIMAESEAISHLILSMTQRGDSLQAQTDICSIFESILTLEDAHVKTTIGDGGGFNVVCEGLKNHVADATFVKHASRCLASMIPVLLPETLEPMREDLGSAVLHAAELHIENAELQIVLIEVLMECCERDHKNDVFFHNFLVHESAGVFFIMQSMKQHIELLDIQRNGCYLIRLLTTPLENRVLIGNNGGVTAVVNAMKAHPHAAGLQKEGLSAIKNLATMSALKAILDAARIEGVVRYSMWIHINDPQVIAGGLPALNNVFVDAGAQTVRLIEAESLQLIMAAMKNFPEEGIIQKNGCFLLKSISYRSKNLALMVESRDTLIPILHSVVAEFPVICQERVNFVLRKMAAYQQHEGPSQNGQQSVSVGSASGSL